MLVMCLSGCAPAPAPVGVVVCSLPPPPPPPQVVTAVVPTGSAVVAEEPKLPEVVARLQKSILEGHGASDVVSSLTTEVGARLAGSPGDKLAVAWALRAMRAAGLANVHT